MLCTFMLCYVLTYHSAIYLTKPAVSDLLRHVPFLVVCWYGFEISISNGSNETMSLNYEISFLFNFK